VSRIPTWLAGLESARRLRAVVRPLLDLGSMAKNSRTTDASVLNRIERLVADEQALYQAGDLNDGDTARLSKIQVELDQCWDLLRQRRALREFGKNPDEAKARPPEVVENYEQ